MRKRNLIFGWTVLAAGVACAVAGICFSAENTQLYLVLEVIAAALILLGITPLVREHERRKTLTGGNDGGNRFRAYMDRIHAQYGGRDTTSDPAGDRRHGFVPPGESLLAEIIGVTRNLRGSGGEQVEYYVICRYYDDKTRTNQTFTSQPLRDYPGREIIGKKVKVIFHSKDPEDYTVDLGSIQ